MKKLRAWNALENTLVIFMTDNGMSMGAGTINGQRFAPYNAGLRGGKSSPDEGGTHVPAFWYWPGVLGEGVDIPALAAHLDLYRTFCDLAGAELPHSKLPPGGRSLLPLLEDPQADWPDRKLFIHSGRWQAGQRESRKYTRCAVRTQRWRWVNNQQLYDMSRDAGGTKNVAAQHPQVMQELRAAYDQWWDATEPLLVNEGLPKVEPGQFYLQRLYRQQQQETGIPTWQPAEI